jgi:hypothetical protein
MSSAADRKRSVVAEQSPDGSPVKPDKRGRFGGQPAKHEREDRGIAVCQSVEVPDSWIEGFKDRGFEVIDDGGELDRPKLRAAIESAVNGRASA